MPFTALTEVRSPGCAAGETRDRGSAFTALTEVPAVRGVAPADCDFYHRFEVPGLGETDGAWDLRAGAAEYQGHAALAGKTVLEIGPASGFLSFWMEARGASVTCLEPDLERFWDLVPTAKANLLAFHDDFRHH